MVSPEHYPDQVLVVCPNPALELTYYFPNGEDDVRKADKVIWQASGRGLNVARVLKGLGCNPKPVACLGGHIGRCIKERARQVGLRCITINTNCESRCSVVTVNRKTGTATLVRSDGLPVTAAISDALADKVRALSTAHSLVCISGGALPGFRSDLFERMCADASAGGAKVFVDCSGPDLLSTLRAKPFIVKINSREAEQTFDTAVSEQGRRVDALEKIRSLGAQNAIITTGSNGATALIGQSLYEVSVQALSVVNPIGAGDAFMAGLIARLAVTDDWVSILKFATTVAVASTQTESSGELPEGASSEFGGLISVSRKQRV